jgi:hypothetical protein
VAGEACDWREAVELVQRTAPDLVLLDVEMPHLDGALRGRADPQLPHADPHPDAQHRRKRAHAAKLAPVVLDKSLLLDTVGPIVTFAAEMHPVIEPPANAD